MKWEEVRGAAPAAKATAKATAKKKSMKDLKLKLQHQSLEEWMRYKIPSDEASLRQGGFLDEADGLLRDFPEFFQRQDVEFKGKQVEFLPESPESPEEEDKEEEEEHKVLYKKVAGLGAEGSSGAPSWRKKTCA